MAVKTGSYTLRDYPSDVVRLACTKCPRKGQYRKSTLIAAHGPNISLPDLLAKISRCTGGITSGQWSNCGARYVDLVPKD